jgi:hypothetical protein
MVSVMEVIQNAGESRVTDSSQDTNDRHDDHQFDKGKAGLCAAGESTTVH